MPNPMSLDPDHQPTGHQPTGHHRQAYRAAAPDTPASEFDSSGRPLALRLPDWDLVPPTEFLQRHPDR